MRKQIAGIFARAAFVTLAFAGMSAGAVRAEGDRVNQGVILGGIDIGGMNFEEVEAAVSDKIDVIGQTQVTVAVDEQERNISLSQLGLSWANTDVMDDIMELGMSGNIVQRYKDRKDLEHDQKYYELTYCLDENLVNVFASSLTECNTQPENASIYTADDLTPAVEGGTPGISVRVEDTAALIKSCTDSWDEASPIYIDAPTDKVEPDVPYDELSIICDDLGHATTYYGGSDWGRVTNVENGCSMISGTLLYPGDYFSVANALAPFTPENGYELAGAYEENQVVQAYGGGICQVSTTLYNAVLKAELEVTERSNHSMVVGYVDLSKDAAIAEGLMDMCFVNNLDDPVYIIGYCDGAEITFWIYGHETRPANRTLELVSVTTSTTEPTGARLMADTEQPVGYINQTQSPHTGYTAELWKNIYIDGEMVDSVQINSSSYAAVGTIYDIGVATSSVNLSQAMYNAISLQDINQVYTVINQAANYMKESESETDKETEESDAQQNGETSADGSQDYGQTGYEDTQSYDQTSDGGMSDAQIAAEIAADQYGGEGYGYGETYSDGYGY